MTTVPDTFRSEQALAEAVDEAFAEALAEELATAFTEPEETQKAAPIALPETAELIAQAGITTGPCPPDPRTPSRNGRLAKTGLRLACGAAWWLVKGSVYVTALLLLQAVRTAWHLTAPAAPEAAQPEPRASEFLTATSDEIHRLGWTQDRYQDDRGVCVLGAQNALLRRGVGTPAVADRSCDYLLAAVHRRSVPAWNDGLARRESDIHTALLHAAARARAAND